MKKRTGTICSIGFAIFSILLYFVGKIPAAKSIFYSTNNTVVFPAIGLFHKLGWDMTIAIGIAFCIAMCIYFFIFYQTE